MPRASASVSLGLGLGLALAWAGAPGCVPKPHSYASEPRTGALRVAVLPLANYTANREAADRVLPMLAVELGRQPGIVVLDPGRVEEVVSREPWLLMDRIPPDLVDRFGTQIGADALLVGSVMSYAIRDTGAERIPQLSLSLRLLAVPGGKVLWSSVHSRDGADGEWLFGIGRVENLERLAVATVREMMATFPGEAPESKESLAGKAE